MTRKQLREDFRFAFVLCLMNLATDYLNQSSWYFKDHKDKRIRDTYDIVKDAASKIRAFVQ